jgi:hypothetical protein
MHDPANIFDDIDSLRQDAARVKKQSKTAGARRGRGDETFARVYHDRALKLYGRITSAAAWVVLIELDRTILTSNG